MKANKGQKAVKVLILTPLITTVLSLLLILSYPVIRLLDWGSDSGFDPEIYTVLLYVFMALALFSLTAGLLMAVIGSVLAIKNKRPLFIVLGVVLAVFLLIAGSYCYWAVFVNENDTRGPPVVTSDSI